VSRWKNLLVPVGLLAAVLLVYAALPLGTSIEMGGDEGFELMKPVLCNHGFSLYKQIWNDQPPLFSKLLAWSMNSFGTSAVVPRTLVAGFGLLLFAALYWAAAQRSGPWCGLLAAFFLAASPGILLLSASVMQEVPTFALAMLSVPLLFQYYRTDGRWMWLVASGIVLGLALQIKFTAALVMPAILLEIIFGPPRQSLNQLNRRTGMGAKIPDASPAPGSSRLTGSVGLLGVDWGKARQMRRMLFDATAWVFSAAAAFLVVYVLFGQGSFETSKSTHLLAGIVPTADTFSKGPNDFPLSWSLFWDHIECVAAALVGILAVFFRKRMRELAFPITLLLTVLPIHLLHRPWWPYYYLHIAIPLAWLSAFAVTEGVVVASRLLSTRPFDFFSLTTWKAFGLCGLIGLVLVRSELRLEASVREMRERPTINHPLIRKMREYAGGTHWVYAERGIFVFQAGLLTPPELAVVSPKRFWSGQITTPQIIEICKRYGTEQILLNLPIARAEWREYLKDDFVPVWQDDKFILYVAKKVAAGNFVPPGH
jgi:hypothetical protein